MNANPGPSGAAPGIRLAKRVMALAHCSRREAEALIEAGAVQLDGQAVRDPARRVQDSQSLSLAADAQAALRTLEMPLTLLCHQGSALAEPAMAATPDLASLISRLPGLTPGGPAPSATRLARLRPLLALPAGLPKHRQHQEAASAVGCEHVELYVPPDREASAGRLQLFNTTLGKAACMRALGATTECSTAVLLQT